MISITPLDVLPNYVWTAAELEFMARRNVPVSEISHDTHKLRSMLISAGMPESIREPVIDAIVERWKLAA